MKKTSKTVIFFGNERLATGVTTTNPTLRGLLGEGYNIASIVVNQSTILNTSPTRTLEIGEVADKHKLPILSPDRLGDISEQLYKLNAEIGILVAYGRIVPQKIIDIFPKGILNIHPSLLPLHRGPTPIESVMIAGESQTGVSIMRLESKMDAGAIYAQERVVIPSNVTKQALASTLLKVGSDLLLKILPGVLDGSLEATPQTGTPTYDNIIEKKDGMLDWHESSIIIERKIRAFATWPRSRAKIGGMDVIITEAHTSEVNVGIPGTIKIENGKLLVGCREGCLIIERLIPLGKKEMDIHAFLLGYSRRLQD